MFATDHFNGAGADLRGVHRRAVALGRELRGDRRVVPALLMKREDALL